VRLDEPLVKTLGDRTAKVLAAKLGLHTVGDLLHHYPRRYFTYGALTRLKDLEEGEHVTVLARVVSSEVRKSRNGKQLGKVVVTDGESTLELAFFGRVATWACPRLKEGARHLFAGRVSTFNNKRQLAHPQVFSAVDEKLLSVPGSMLAIYPAAEGIDTIAIRKAVDIALAHADLDADPLPLSVRLEHDLMSLREAIESIHRPGSQVDIDAARRRLRWDEAFVLQVVLARRRHEQRLQSGTARTGVTEGLLDAFDASIPFVLTGGQHEIGKVIAAELAQEQPMHRLLQGEVGSGKTVVALRAMLTVVDSGGQAALLAPTEVLAQQHARSLRAMLGPLARGGELGSPDIATRVALLTGSLGAAARRNALAEVATGEAGIVVGTHALLSEGVEFDDLGLVVVDEQHRFGVEQRDALRAKGKAPHVLVMTATPIPRTMAITTYGDLEVSTLRELPLGRSPIRTAVIGTTASYYPGRMLDLIREQVSQGRQAFVVCARIGDEALPPADPDKPPAHSVVDVLEWPSKSALSSLRVEALHGRMSPEAKDDVMHRFVLRDIEVLVATTVIEVGVDVPNATVMVVMDADRFGISQLHQLRGRIGRGEHAGTCVLVTSCHPESLPVARLRAVAETTDGFALSQLDLEVRQEGDVLGVDQSGGRRSLKLLKLTDLDVIERSRELAAELVASDPDLSGHPSLRQAVDAILDEQRQAFIDKA
jgi:ATP-dependent DNA helicase RecG